MTLPGAPRRPRLSFLHDNARWLGAGALLTFSSSWGQTYFISIFAGSIRGEFGLTDGEWGAIYGSGTLISALLVILVGGVIDRFRVRTLGSLVLAAAAAACVLMAAVPAAWALIPAVLALRFTGQGLTSLIATTAMARWFVAQRGQALAIGAMGYAVGESVLPILFVALLTVAPWRSLWLLAAAIALLAIPILRLLLHQERVPSGAADGDETAGIGGRHWTRHAALRHPLFWFALPLIVGPSAWITALFFQQVHLAAQKGWTHLELVALFPVYTTVSMGAMLAGGLLIDRIGTRRMMPVAQLPLAAGFVVMGMVPGLPAGALAMALIATSHGVWAPLTTAFWAELYGTRHLGAIKALAAGVMVLGTAIGPVVSGVAIDAGFAFDQQMPVMALWFLATSGMIAIALSVWAPVRAEESG